MIDKMIDEFTVEEINEQSQKIADMQLELNKRIAEDVNKLPNVNYPKLTEDLIKITETFSIVPIGEKELTTFLSNQIKVLENIKDVGNPFFYNTLDTLATFNADYSYVAQQLVDSGVITMKEVEALYKTEFTNILNNPPTTAPTSISELEEYAKVFAKDKVNGKFLVEDNVTYRINSKGRKERAEYWYERNAREYITNTADERLKKEMAIVGYDLALVSAHSDCSELCAFIQGDVVSVFGKSEKHISLEEAKERGFRHWGCRHSMSAYDPEFSEDTRKEFQKEIVSNDKRNLLYQKRQQGNYNKRQAIIYNDRYERALKLGEVEKAKIYKNKRKAFKNKAKELGVFVNV